MHRKLAGSIFAFAAVAAWFAAPLAAQALKPAALHTGIQAHGRWTIVVRNPDGSVAAKRQFGNTLQLDGVNALPILLGGFAAPGGWGVYLGASSGVGPCASPSLGYSLFVPGQTTETGVVQPCLIVDPAASYTASIGPTGPSLGCTGIYEYGCSPTLSVALVKTGSVTEPIAGLPEALDVAGLQLTGTAAVTSPAEGDTVGTILVLCNATASSFTTVPGYPPESLTAGADISPASCRASTTSSLLQSSVQPTFPFWGITATTIPNGPINVIPKQTVQVTVLISFS